MAAYTGTVTQRGKGGDLGDLFIAKGEYTFGTEIEDTDTITWSNILPQGGAKVHSFRIYGVELDSNATPTATFVVGDGTDADGYLTTKGGAVGLQNSLAGQLVYFGDGALLDTNVTSTDIVLTMTAATATGASTGTIYIEVLGESI